MILGDTKKPSFKVSKNDNYNTPVEAWEFLGARVALRRPPRNRLKISAYRGDTVSDDLLETRRLNRTDG